MPEWVGKVLSKVMVQKHLGAGGMADVYLGHHSSLERPVVVKILHSHLTGNEHMLKRFHAEAQAASLLRHPNIVQIFDFDLSDGYPYIVMELLPGMPLDDYLKSLHSQGKRLAPETTLRIIISLAAALDYAHGRGIVHRDIKPGNVILRREGDSITPGEQLPFDTEPVLVDFGLAHFAARENITSIGEILGTPAYISPEQARGEAVDGRSDIYSLGIMLYEMLAGKAPFDAPTESPVSIILKHLTTNPPPIEGVHPAIQRVLDRALTKQPEQRYARAGEFANELMLALFGRESALFSPIPQEPLSSLQKALNLLLEQAQAYERALPPSNYPARAAVSALARLARQAQGEARSLAESLEPSQPADHPFSPREYEVLNLAAGGLTNKEIAYRLGISERTVQFHLNSIFNKTTTQSRTEAVALALKNGWLGKE